MLTELILQQSPSHYTPSSPFSSVTPSHTCRKLAGLGVPVLRTLFQQVFGQETASNNAAWLRRKLAESPDSIHGQRRSPVVRARDVGAAIWNQDADHPSDDHQGQPAEWQQQGNDPMGVQQQQQLGNGFGGGAGGACGQQMEGGAEGSLGHSMGHQESGPTPKSSPGAPTGWLLACMDDWASALPVSVLPVCMG